MPGSGRESLPDVREWAGGPPGCLAVVGRPSKGSEVVGRPSQMPGSGQKAIPNVREWSGVSPGCPGVFVRPSWMSRSGQETLLYGQEWPWIGLLIDLGQLA